MMRRVWRSYPAWVCATASLLLAGCYKIDIQQGNVVTPEVVAELRPGMTKREVRYLLGTPLVVDPFHEDRWDYFYTFRRGGEKQREQQRLTLTFDNDQLVTIDGDESVTTVDAKTLEVPDADEGVPGEENPGFFERTWNKVRGQSTSP